MRILIVIGFVLALVVPTRHATAQSILVDESGTPAEQVLNTSTASTAEVDEGHCSGI